MSEKKEFTISEAIKWLQWRLDTMGDIPVHTIKLVTTHSTDGRVDKKPLKEWLLDHLKGVKK